MTAPEASEPQPDPDDDAPDEPTPPSEPSDEVPDTLPEDWTATPAAAAEEEPDGAEDPGEEQEVERDLDAAFEHMAELEARLEAAERRSDELLGVSKRQAQMADQLHAENQKLRDGEIAQAVAPLVRNAARIADELAHILDSRAGDADLEHIAKRLSELLHDAGVSSVTPAAGDPFDPRTHQAAGATPTAVASEDRCVAEVRKPGLMRDDGRMLRPAEVVVYRYTPPTDEEGAAP